MRRLSTLLASAWLLLAVASAAAGAATPSADDSRLLPYGPVAHLWILPKVGNHLPCLALDAAGRLPAARCLPSAFVVRRGLRLVRAERPRVPRALRRRRVLPRRAGDDPPLPA